MKTMIKTVAIAMALTFAAGAAMAAEQAMKDCCEKCDCCKDMQTSDAKPGSGHGPDHKH